MLSDKDACQLIRDYLPFAERTIKRFVSQHPDLDALELESRAMEAYWLTAGKFDPSRGLSFATYAGARMKGRMRDYARTERSRRRAYTAFAQQNPFDDEDPLHGLDLIERPELDEDVERGLEEWLARIDDPRHREALLLRLQGRTSKEIAKELTVDASTVCRWLQRAREIIQAPTS